ncbi:excinuclease ABC subunit UvrC [Pseudomonas aeruginosa]|nr:excinuclease ABC subunit UvrC [Pseudomonas aeruginosa]
MQAGAAGYMTKGAGLEEMVQAIRQVFAGQRYISPQIAQQLALKSFQPQQHDSPFDSLSEREIQIALMIANCHKVQSISDKLCLSPKTVNTYRYRIFEKLSITSDVELALLAVRHGMVDAASQMSAVFDASAFLATCSNRPGVYRMFDADAKLLYVGKAKSLKKRLASYFRKSGLAPKTAALVARIAQVETTITANETEALLLEQTLIKEWRPPYNILLRDDKSYPFVFLSSEDEYPRLSLHRGAKKRKGRYFGPYPSAGAIRESLNLLQKAFLVRQCEDSYFRNRTRPCLQYQIKRCKGPCVGLVSPEEYAEDVRHSVMFLEGRSNALADELNVGMEQAAMRLDFEKAAELRDQVAILRRVQDQQSMEGGNGDVDIVAAIVTPGGACVHLISVRGGRVLGSKNFFPQVAIEEEVGEVLLAFLGQYYLSHQERDLPAELIVNVTHEDFPVLVSAIAEARGRELEISYRVRGTRARWQQLAVTNAEQALGARLANRQHVAARFEALAEALDLAEPPQRLECFDISHSSGEATVASCVVFGPEGPLKSDYRRYNIEGVTAGDDYAAMHQALTRRFSRLKDGEGKMPDILLVDGGKGQLAMAQEVLQELAVAGLILLGVAKGVTRKPGLETLYLNDASHEFTLPADSPALHLIQQIRDEAHRFAITGHRARRGKARRTSTLEDVPGVGPKRRRDLLKYFGGLQELSRASIDELAKAPGISKKLAEQIYAVLHSE